MVTINKNSKDIKLKESDHPKLFNDVKYIGIDNFLDLDIIDGIGHNLDDLYDNPGFKANGDPAEMLNYYLTEGYIGSIIKKLKSEDNASEKENLEDNKGNIKNWPNTELTSNVIRDMNKPSNNRLDDYGEPETDISSDRLDDIYDKRLNDTELSPSEAELMHKARDIKVMSRGIVNIKEDKFLLVDYGDRLSIIRLNKDEKIKALMYDEIHLVPSEEIEICPQFSFESKEPEIDEHKSNPPISVSIRKGDDYYEPSKQAKRFTIDKSVEIYIDYRDIKDKDTYMSENDFEKYMSTYVICNHEGKNQIEFYGNHKLYKQEIEETYQSIIDAVNLLKQLKR